MASHSLRILYISPGGIAARGGMGSVARCLIGNFSALQSPPVVTIVNSNDPEHRYLMPLYFLPALARLAWAGLTHRADVVHIHMAHRGSVWRKIALLRLAGFFRLPVLLHLHGSEFEVFCESLPASRRQWVARQLARAGRIVVLGTPWRDYLVNGLHIDANKVVVVPNGVDVPDIVASRTNDVCRIVALGLLSERKGTPELLRALASPVMKDLPWTALIAGNGNVDFYRAEAQRLGIAAKVNMPGWLAPARAKEKLAAADIFVLPSHNEGLPMAVLEAMAAGIPVVTTPVGAMTDLVVDHETGLLVPPGQAETLAGALAQLVRDADTRRLYGQNGRRRVEETFNSRLFAANIARLYTDLYDKGPPSGTT